MQGVQHLVMCLQISRCVSTSSACLNIRRESRFMKKIIHGSHKSKKKWYDNNTDLRSTVNINPTNNAPSLHTRRRMIIRDKLFMEHITDMMSMGEVDDILKGDVEITHVKITPDFKLVNVFWIPSNNALIDEEALQRCAKIIRHELSQLRVIGIVPPIQFVQNKQFAIQKEVEKRLAAIEQFEQENNETSCFEQDQLNIPDNADQTLSKQSIANRESEIDDSYIQLPKMRHDVLGLDHHKIMSQITAAVSKSNKAAQRQILNTNTNTDENSQNLVSKKVEYLTRKEQEKVFSEFLMKKRREERRRKRLIQSHKRELLNNFEEEEFDYEEYENDIGYIEDFNDETQK